MISMSKERRNLDVLNASRRQRIAADSGTDVQDVYKLIKQFREAQKLMKILETRKWSSYKASRESRLISN